MAKVMISLPDHLLADVDAEAKRRSTSRSAFLALAVRRELERRTPELIAAAISRSRARFDPDCPFEAAETVREDRDARS